MRKLPLQHSLTSPHHSSTAPPFFLKGSSTRNFIHLSWSVMFLSTQPSLNVHFFLYYRRRKGESLICQVNYCDRAPTHSLTSPSHLLIHRSLRTLHSAFCVPRCAFCILQSHCRLITSGLINISNLLLFWRGLR